ncbi:MAG TPA: neutral/alkaline non-lysosomal ceramidase N-terminal domain-containing protein [Candidatus Paceibacterota bacterium]|nr:neutral/alkaline non-lysosomal ceramidase N-terminal domain-containing protein [Verrucomicrobiota bacterium]HSA09280.1 neutral/alkaline non-lysosomal ceramidase N-terminal domain-containing protein [Candidatus Paceibacterota bacterium]
MPANNHLPRRLLIPLLLLTFGALPALAAKETFYAVGAAQVDITPDYPIRLNGYGARVKESEGIDQHIYAQALAIGSSKRSLAIVVTVDNVAVPAHLREEVAARLAKKAGLRNERFALCSTHTHTAPMLTGSCPNIFGADLPPDQQERVDRYTIELTDKLEQVALAALKARQPATLAWGQTKAGFAANRRTKDGPVDHDLPALVARDKSGRVRALFTSYACHCTTLADTPNRICGDWAGYAREHLEGDHPGAIVLVALGCGADANPNPRTGLEFATQNGNAIRTAVNELVRRPLSPLRQKLACQTKPISLAYDTLPTREQWTALAQSDNHWIAYHAKKNLARLDRGEKLPTRLPYLVQTWNFGQELAMVFLPGEVVVDYSLRLKKEYDPTRLWVNAYANDVPCYIPSKRIWREGGYEGGDAMIYFDRPTRLVEGTEELIVSTVHELLPPAFLAPR